MWRLIETAPKDGTECLFFGYRKKYTNITKPYIEVGSYWQGHWTPALMTDFDEPTHWMPLPEGPQS